MSSYDMIDRYLRNNLDDDDYAEYSAALDSISSPPISQQLQPAAQLRLEAALERAGAAESVLRRLVDECENENIHGWEDRMIECIDSANKLLSTQPKQQSPKPQENQNE